MAASQTIAWDDPWIAPVVTGPGGLGDEETTIDGMPNNFPSFGSNPSAVEARVYFTLAIPKTVTATLYSRTDDVMCTRTASLPAGPHAISLQQLLPLPIGYIVMELPGASAGTPDSITNVEVQLAARHEWYDIEIGVGYGVDLWLSDQGPRNNSYFTNFDSGSGPATWQDGQEISSVVVTVMNVVGLGGTETPITVSIFDDAPTLNLLATDTQMIEVGQTTVFTLPVIGNLFDIDRLFIDVDFSDPDLISGIYSAKASIEVFFGGASEFWTDFVKSYEIP